MSTDAWIFMIGIRVFDVGLLVVWLVWFFRLRNDDDAPEDDGSGGGGSGPTPRPGPGGGGDRLPLGRMRQGNRRARDHARLGANSLQRRGADPMRQPARVRRPRTPAPAHRRG